MKTRLDQLLVVRGLFESRAKARAAIEAGGVRVGGEVVTRPATLVADDTDLAAEAAHPWVSRAGLKLAGALDQWPVDPAGRVVLDVGASTGGFTEVCLTRGARRVFAVDVGRGQLHPRIAPDPRVANLEATDARTLTREVIDEAPSLVVCDASFIGLAKVLPAALDLAVPGADLIALIKPQFEVGPAAVGKGGLVRDEAAIDGAIEGVRGFLEASGWPVLAIADSPILGGEGAKEFLFWAVKREASPPAT